MEFVLAKVLGRKLLYQHSLPARCNFCCLLITFANSFDPGQARQNNVFKYHSDIIWVIVSHL